MSLHRLPNDRAGAGSFISRFGLHWGLLARLAGVQFETELVTTG